jgi:hypothetical protein
MSTNNIKFGTKLYILVNAYPLVHTQLYLCESELNLLGEDTAYQCFYSTEHIERPSFGQDLSPCSMHQTRREVYTELTGRNAG